MNAERGKLIDLSVALAPETPVFANYAPVEITILASSTSDSAAAGRPSNNSSRIAIGLHTGTHMDAPFHFIHEGRRIDQVPLAQCAGPALLLPLPDLTPRAPILPEAFLPHEATLRELRKVVLNTGWHHRWGAAGYFTEHPNITPEAGRFLVDCGVELIGVDFPSVDLPPHPTHVVMLGSGMVIVENLMNLDALPAGPFYLAAFPLKIVGRDGSPVRAVAVVA
jgi:kynurenine formamidase